MPRFEIKLIRPPPKDFTGKCNAKQQFLLQSQGGTQELIAQGNDHWAAQDRKF